MCLWSPHDIKGRGSKFKVQTIILDKIVGTRCIPNEIENFKSTY